VPGAALALAWTLAYSVVGGVNGLVGLTGFVWLRAAERNSAWILALVLLWAAVAVSRLVAARRAASVVAAATALTLTLADQLPPRTSLSAIGEIGWHVASDAAFAQLLEARLPAGSMLFQLPVVDFPEGRRVLGATDYEHLRPYLHASQLRFSYGSDKNRPREAWQRRAEALPPAATASALERIGFAGLIVNRKAYPDAAAALRHALAAEGRSEAWGSSDGDFLLIRLRPVVRAVAPDEVFPRSDEAGTAGASLPSQPSRPADSPRRARRTP
jgi:phosphoglycerol transferase